MHVFTHYVILLKLDESDWTTALNPPRSVMFTNLEYSAAEDVTKSAVLLNEDDPGEAGEILLFPLCVFICISVCLIVRSSHHNSLEKAAIRKYDVKCLTCTVNLH